jgi:hypothetical protein
MACVFTWFGKAFGEPGLPKKQFSGAPGCLKRRFLRDSGHRGYQKCRILRGSSGPGCQICRVLRDKNLFAISKVV